MGKTSKDFRDNDRLAKKRQKALRDNFKERARRDGSEKNNDQDNVMELKDDFEIYATKEDK